MISNPIIKGFHPDPCVCRAGDDYYIATSTFEWFPGIRIFHSKDLKNWKLASMPLDTVEKLDMKGNPDSGGIWAPALSYADGKFWLLYTDVKVIDAPWKNGRNYLVTAENIEGPWSEPIPMGNGGFDPSLFHADDGKKYYVYRTWGPRNHSDPINEIVVQEYDVASQRLVSDRQPIFNGTDLKYTEAPHLYKKDGYYYLLTAEGGTSFEHHVTVARSKHLLGPYEVSPQGALLSTWHTPDNPLQKAGHGSLVETPDGEWFITYLVSRPLKFAGRPRLARWGRGACSLGRETGIDRIEWISGWPAVVGGKHAKLEIPELNLAVTSPAESESVYDDFSAESLLTHWQTLRIPFTESMGSLNERQGYLRLRGNDSLLSTFEQSTVATRWRHHDFIASTKLEFEPTNFQQSAGLCCYYNTSNWTYLAVEFDEARKCRCLRVMQVDKQAASYHFYDDESIEIPDDVRSVWLSVNVEGLTYQYSYSFDGKVWQKLPLVLDAWRLSDDYIDGRGFFTGAFVGLHCADISGFGCHADFEEFSYEPTGG
ncbi:glycoside hydrolase family 43 protein [Vibrio breoganii]|uniref:glycoside hydrolase family 43 protein n=1 Tax=Vibrio breoganii TaxID=553239 RepID=UPI000C85AF09|nr:glycoside hydrolase family 43 protein [Vibrio breoganii]PML61069.1 beta-xylosidase [Vibrio breoganii]PMO83633.1 beta-xylosidase [Vibrio breoganii]